MNRFLFLLIGLFTLVSCVDNDINEEPYDNSQLKKFNGKYQLVSSISEKALDLNGDGVFSKELVTENPMISFSTVEIIIPSQETVGLERNEFVYDELFPTENDTRLKYKGAITLEKGVYYPYYDLYGNLLIGKFKKDLKIVFSKKVKINDDGKNTLIEVQSLEILENNKIKVTEIRRFFTSKGWVKTKIESVYKKYTSIT